MTEEEDPLRIDLHLPAQKIERTPRIVYIVIERFRIFAFADTDASLVVTQRSVTARRERFSQVTIDHLLRRSEHETVARRCAGCDDDEHRRGSLSGFELRHRQGARELDVQTVEFNFLRFKRRRTAATLRLNRDSMPENNHQNSEDFDRKFHRLSLQSAAARP